MYHFASTDRNNIRQSSGSRDDGVSLQENHHERRSSRDNPSHRRRRSVKVPSTIPFDNIRLGTDFRSAISRLSCPVPQSLIKALTNRESHASIGKVHVSLRVSPSIPLYKGEISSISLDKKRRQVTILEPKNSSTPDRVGVSAPKMFAFDQVYSREDEQISVVGKVLPDILQAVIGGADGCVTCFGGSSMGKSQTMVGSHMSVSELGIMPIAISWLFQAISHLKVSKASRFSVRVSAIVVDAPGKEVSDVLGDFAQENETSPGALLRQGTGGLLSSVSELRAPFPEIAARYLDFALSARSALSSGTSRSTSGPTTLVFTLHIYQYTFDKKEKGRVVGGRSRLHLIDFGDMSGYHSESLSLSGLTSVLLAIFNGHKYLPHKYNRLTQLLQEILGSVTCHAAMIVHISASPKHSQHTLATLQLASRIHRLRRKKIRGLVGSSGSGGSSEGSRKKSSGGETSAGSSSVDFSSSEQSADTVIYIGGGAPGDSSDGEHPPVFFPHHIRRHRSVELPRLRSFEQLRPHTASPLPVLPKRPVSVSPTPTSRSVPTGIARIKPKPPPRHNSTRSLSASSSFVGSPVQSGFYRHQPGVSQIMYPKEGSRETLNSTFNSFTPSNKEHNSINKQNLEPEKHQNYKFYQQPNTMVPIFTPTQHPVTLATFSSRSQHSQETYLHNQSHISSSVNPQQRIQCLDIHTVQPAFIKSPKEIIHHPSKQQCTDVPLSDEQWIDGPRISKSRVNAAKNKICHSETWIDGPSSIAKAGLVSYGFMDDHKKTMIERWVENQTAQVVTHVDDNGQSQRTQNNLNNSRTVSDMLPSANTVPNGEELNIESDVDTLSEDHSSNLPPSESKQPSLIEELERKNLIPTKSNILECQNDNLVPISNLESKIDTTSEDSHVVDAEDVCSQCQALEEECEELNSLLSCEEEECKRQTQNQTHNGLATVVEEPELESAFGGDDPIDSVSLLNNPQTDCEDTDAGACSELENSDLKNDQSTVSEKFKYPRQKVCVLRTMDTSVQVCEEDILRATSSTPCPSEVTIDTSDDHPLRVLSEENLTCASTFTDSCSQMGETGDEGESDGDEDTRPFSLFEATEYGRICQDLTAALQSESANKDLRELANIHRLFSAFTCNQPSNEPESLCNPVILPMLDNQHQPKSLPLLPSNLLASVSKDPILKGSANPSLGMNANVNVIRNRNTNEISCSQQNRTTVRHSMDKSTGTDEPTDSSCKVIPQIDSIIPIHNYHSSETLIDDTSINYQNNVNNRVVRDIHSNNLDVEVPKYLNDKEHNLLFVDQVSFDCKSCEHNYDSCDISDSLHNKYDNDSDCPSSVSEDSEYIIQNSKFSKFLCVGIGRSKSKSSIKSNKNSESKKNIFKIRDSKSSKTPKLKDISKSPDHISKNLIRSPSQLHSQDKAHFSDRLEMEVLARNDIQRKRDDPSMNISVERQQQKCQCSNSPQYPTRIEFCQESSTNSSKDWNVSPLSPQICPSEVPSSSGSKGVPHPMTTSGSLGTTQSLGESSGYESIPRDSECSSFSSSQESEMDEEHRKFVSQGHLFRPAGGACTSQGSTTPNEGEGKTEPPKSQTSFLRHLTKKSSSKTDNKLVSSTTWKYRC